MLCFNPCIMLYALVESHFKTSESAQHVSLFTSLFVYLTQIRLLTVHISSMELVENSLVRMDRGGRAQKKSLR